MEELSVEYSIARVTVRREDLYCRVNPWPADLVRSMEERMKDGTVWDAM